MKASPRVVPDYEVILCPPAESFRWAMHDYPFPLAKWHYHPEYELHLTRTTSGTMMVGDYLGDFEPGCLVLTGPNLPHNWVSNIDAGQLVRNRDMLVQFAPDWAQQIAGLCPEFASIRRLFEDAAYGVEFSGTTALAGQRLLAQIGSSRGAERVILFLRLLEVLAHEPDHRRRLARRAPDMAAADTPAELPAELDQAMRFLMEHYDEDIDLAAVATRAGLAPQAFSRLFKRQTGHTFARYLVLTRVYAACTALTQSQDAITDICFDVGFNNIANFNRQFFKVCGRTPSDYRRSVQKVGTDSRADPFRESRDMGLVAGFGGGLAAEKYR